MQIFDQLEIPLKRIESVGNRRAQLAPLIRCGQWGSATSGVGGSGKGSGRGSGTWRLSATNGGRPAALRLATSRWRAQVCSPLFNR